MTTKNQPGIELENQVEGLLREAKWKYKREVVVGATRPDFLITTNNNDQIIVEVKDWSENTINTARALNQAKRYRELSKVAAALVVTRSGDSITSPDGGVAPVGNFLAMLNQISTGLASKSRSKKIQPSSIPPKKKVFASMPFAANYDDTFLVAIEPAALTHGAIAERVDHNGSVGSVVPQIKAMIRAAKVVVADLSGSRPNVLHEVGYAEALGKPIIQICSTPENELPFNIRNNQTILYTIGQSAKLKKKIENQLQELLPKEV